jgi:hypothetical protein
MIMLEGVENGGSLMPRRIVDFEPSRFEHGIDRYTPSARLMTVVNSYRTACNLRTGRTLVYLTQTQL